MGTSPIDVWTRRTAMIREQGVDPDKAFDFTEEGFSILGTHPDLGPVVYEADVLPYTRVSWPDKATRERARQAMVGDFAEMFGGGA